MTVVLVVEDEMNIARLVRDYLERIHWDKQPPVPSLPEDVVRRTREKYVDAYRLLSGRELQ